VGVHQNCLAVNRVQRRLDWLVPNYGLKFQRTVLVWEVDEVPHSQIKKVQVIPGLNSVRLVEFAYRLQLHDHLTVNDEIGTNVPHVLTVVEHWDDTLGLIVDETLTERHLKGAVIDGLRVPRPKGRPDVPGNLTQFVLHEFWIKITFK